MREEAFTFPKIEILPDTHSLPLILLPNIKSLTVHVLFANLGNVYKFALLWKIATLLQLYAFNGKETASIQM